MAMKVLSQVSAFSAGAQLWVLPDFAHSRWSLKIDWYLNFQISKAQRHKEPELAEYVSEVIHSTGLEQSLMVLKPTASLLVPSEHLLPNRWVLIAPVTKGSFSTWVNEVAKAWNSLQHPSLRLFLPTGLSAGDFQNLWNPHSTTELSVVLD